MKIKITLYLILTVLILSVTNGQKNEKTALTKSIKRINDTFNIVMHPNPTNNMVTIISDTNSKLDITLYDVLGRPIYTKTMTDHNNTLNVSNLSAGAYLVEIKTENKQKAIKKLYVN